MKLYMESNKFKNFFHFTKYLNLLLIIGGMLIILLDILYIINKGSLTLRALDLEILSLGLICVLFGILNKRGIEDIDLQDNFISKMKSLNKWYNKDVWVIFSLIFLFILAFIIRITNLTGLYPYTDEYSHLVAAKSLLETGSTEYTRAYFLSYIISSLFKLFGESLFIARLPGVLFGALTVIPIYLLVKNVSKEAGLISGLVWAMSPWSILVSRNVREYAIFPFFMISYLVIIIHYLPQIIKIVTKEKKIGREDIIMTLVLILPILYAFIDYNSSFKQIFLYFPAILIFINYKLGSKIDKKSYLIIFFLQLCIIIGLSIKILNTKLINFLPFYNDEPMRQLFRGSMPFEYVTLFDPINIFQTFCFLLLVSIFFVGIYYILIKKHDIGTLLLLTFFLEMYFLIFHFHRYFRPRYVYFIFPLFISIIGIGITVIVRIIYNFKLDLKTKMPVYILVCILLILLLINPFSVYNATYNTEQGNIPWTLEYHDNVGPLIDEYKDKIKTDDIIIASLGNMLVWYFDRPIRDQNRYKYNYSDPERFNKIEKIVSEKSNGWIILDSRRSGLFSKGLPREDFELDTTKISFLGTYGKFQVYKWDKR